MANRRFPRQLDKEKINSRRKLRSQLSANCPSPSHSSGQIPGGQGPKQPTLFCVWRERTPSHLLIWRVPRRSRKPPDSLHASRPTLSPAKQGGGPAQSRIAHRTADFPGVSNSTPKKGGSKDAATATQITADVIPQLPKTNPNGQANSRCFPCCRVLGTGCTPKGMCLLEHGFFFGSSSLIHSLLLLPRHFLPSQAIFTHHTPSSPPTPIFPHPAMPFPSLCTNVIRRDRDMHPRTARG
ncbi:hypothetical protein QBC34DRAFT_404152 [Podospora aff. communis PSN243]|uniref:Uncharacterized protein n=1 Tax=Podospora aff. communis PSN243 TaxID=3040156 RepID=A0AAV9GPL3_9PEZI|nr:hypothetical protein QBC34DRAFT_404152 [Podospora aff. communis PSN243]